MLGLVLGLLVLVLGPAQSPATAADESPSTESPATSAADTAASSSPAASANTGASDQDSEASHAPAGRTIVYGIPGLTINDIDPVRTPNLYALFSDGAAANLNVRTIGSATCPGSGWLSLGAGARAEAGPPADPDEADSTATCPPLSAPSPSDEAVAKTVEKA
ncbi:MAG: hypothetical protein L0G36_02415, partial [Brevibacterium sp.]|nr:hypothetical protein [Brevibacterium sp.]